MKRQIISGVLLLAGGLWFLAMVTIALQQLSIFGVKEGLLSVMLTIEWLWQAGVSLAMIIAGMFVANK